MKRNDPFFKTTQNLLEITVHVSPQKPIYIYLFHKRWLLHGNEARILFWPPTIKRLCFLTLSNVGGGGGAVC